MTTGTITVGKKPTPPLPDPTDSKTDNKVISIKGVKYLVTAFATSNETGTPIEQKYSIDEKIWKEIAVAANKKAKDIFKNNVNFIFDRKPDDQKYIFSHTEPKTKSTYNKKHLGHDLAKIFTDHYFSSSPSSSPDALSNKTITQDPPSPSSSKKNSEESVGSPLSQKNKSEGPPVPSETEEEEEKLSSPSEATETTKEKEVKVKTEEGSLPKAENTKQTTENIKIESKEPPIVQLQLKQEPSTEKDKILLEDNQKKKVAVREEINQDNELVVEITKKKKWYKKIQNVFSLSVFKTNPKERSESAKVSNVVLPHHSNVDVTEVENKPWLGSRLKQLFSKSSSASNSNILEGQNISVLGNQIPVYEHSIKDGEKNWDEVLTQLINIENPTQQPISKKELIECVDSELNERMKKKDDFEPETIAMMLKGLRVYLYRTSKPQLLPLHLLPKEIRRIGYRSVLAEQDVQALRKHPEAIKAIIGHYITHLQINTTDFLNSNEYVKDTFFRIYFNGNKIGKLKKTTENIIILEKNDSNEQQISRYIVNHNKTNKVTIKNTQFLIKENDTFKIIDKKNASKDLMENFVKEAQSQLKERKKTQKNDPTFLFSVSGV